MKNMLKKICVTLLALATIMVCGASAFADDENGTDIGKQGTVYISASAGGKKWRGSGFAIGKPGEPVEYIVTNWHVATYEGQFNAKDVSILVYLSNSAAGGSYIKASVAKIGNEKLDYAVLKLAEPTKERTALVLRPETDGVKSGMEIRTLGFPGDADILDDLKDKGIGGITVTSGIISKPVEHLGVGCYQIDATFNGGNSGGPLIDKQGRVVGINTFHKVSDGTERMLFYSIKIDEVIAQLDQNKFGYVLSTDSSASSGTSDTSGTVTPTTPDNTTSSGSSMSPWIIVAIAGGACVVIAVVIIVVMNGKKNSAPAQANNSQAAPQAAPTAPQAAPSQPANFAQAMVVGERGALAGRTFAIGSGVLIGRNPQKCGIVFPVDTKGVSGVHCEIRPSKNGGFEIIDRGSSNGTTLGNGQRLSPNVPVPIASGTYVSLGSNEQMIQIKY